MYFFPFFTEQIDQVVVIYHVSCVVECGRRKLLVPFALMVHAREAAPDELRALVKNAVKQKQNRMIGIVAKPSP